MKVWIVGAQGTCKKEIADLLAEEKRIKEEEFAQRKKDLEAWRDKFFDVVKNGTKKNDLLVVHYKYSDFSKKYCGSFDKYTDTYYYSSDGITCYFRRRPTARYYECQRGS